MFSVDQGKLVYNLFLEYALGGNFLDLMIKKYGARYLNVMSNGTQKCRLKEFRIFIRVIDDCKLWPGLVT
ncbi:hypothetical protein PTKIN_Ptkin12aG0030500 [Pterospermum kingtungense]